jgi:hypothetical protein
VQYIYYSTESILIGGGLSSQLSPKPLPVDALLAAEGPAVSRASTRSFLNEGRAFRRQPCKERGPSQPPHPSLWHLSSRRNDRFFWQEPLRVPWEYGRVADAVLRRTERLVQRSTSIEGAPCRQPFACRRIEAHYRRALSTTALVLRPSQLQ